MQSYSVWNEDVDIRSSLSRLVGQYSEVTVEEAADGGYSLFVGMVMYKEEKSSAVTLAEAKVEVLRLLASKLKTEYHAVLMAIEEVE